MSPYWIRIPEDAGFCRVGDLPVRLNLGELIKPLLHPGHLGFELFGLGTACGSARIQRVKHYLRASLHFDDRLSRGRPGDEIVVGHNANLSIPTWDFQGAPLGIDIRKVVATSITPIINTGIASLEPGVGQIGAGTVRAPLACFVKALEALAVKYGVTSTDD